MRYETALDIHRRLEAAVGGDADAQMLYSDLVSLAVEYARMRTDWQLADGKKRMNMDEARTITHNALIGACNALARYLARQEKGYKLAPRSNRRPPGDRRFRLLPARHFRYRGPLSRTALGPKQGDQSRNQHRGEHIPQPQFGQTQHVQPDA